MLSNLRRLRLGYEKKKKKERKKKKPHGKNIMAASDTQGGHNNPIYTTDHSVVSFNN